MTDVIVVYSLVFLYGISIGSFLNVCIYRIPRGESIVKNVSHCTACGQKIKVFDLIPVFSYIALRGKCRGCGAKISPRYMTVEMLCAALWMFLFYNLGFTWRFLFFAVMSAALIVITLTDIEFTEIPDKVVLTLLAAGVIYNIVSFDLHFTVNSVVGFFAASVPLYIMAVVTNGGMGGGDIKLMAVCGLFVGWRCILLAMFIGAVAACLFTLVQALAGKRREDKGVVFGPFLSVGIIAAGLYGEPLIEWYLSLFVNL